MTRNDLLQRFILKFGLSAPDEYLGHATDFSRLWQEAKKSCFDCDRNEVLDALYTLPREYAALVKVVPTEEGYHPVSFERVRNTVNWPEYFTTGEFSVQVLPEGRAYYSTLCEQLEKTAA